MRKLWRILIILVLIAGASAGVYAWTRNGKKNANGLKEVDVTTGSILEKAVAVGQIQPRQKFSVKSKISGIVRRSMIQVGDTVKAGDPLFEIAPDPTPLEVTEVDRRVESAAASRASPRRRSRRKARRCSTSRSSSIPARRSSFELATPRTPTSSSARRRTC